MAQGKITARAQNHRHPEELESWYCKDEVAIEPGMPIIDSHHHLHDRPGGHYLLPQLLGDLNTGHNIRATVFVECTAMYKTRGPVHLRPIGETEFINGIAAMADSGYYGECRACAGIVGFADLMLGDKVQEVLQAQITAGGGRFRGIRNRAQYDTIFPEANRGVKDLLMLPSFREGFKHLARLNLSYDAWQFFTQLPDLLDLARAFPSTSIVINHVGGTLGIGEHEGRRDEIFPVWKKSMKELSACQNVTVKLGGLGMPMVGFEYLLHERSPSSDDLAKYWKPYIETCIEFFGPQRCMFESNFPPDRQSGKYGTFWNAFKKLTTSYSVVERSALFHDTAAKVYRLDLS